MSSSTTMTTPKESQEEGGKTDTMVAVQHHECECGEKKDEGTTTIAFAMTKGDGGGKEKQNTRVPTEEEHLSLTNAKTNDPSRTIVQEQTPPPPMWNTAATFTNDIPNQPQQVSAVGTKFRCCHFGSCIFFFRNFSHTQLFTHLLYSTSSTSLWQVLPTTATTRRRRSSRLLPS
jgi:hypothetical protein